jgi:PAS domain S-box-containing protein
MSEQVDTAQPRFAAVQDMGDTLNALMHSLDWAQTPLGAAAGWPPPLRSALAICFGMPVPSLIWWGTTRVILYNDEAANLLGIRHPDALGQPGEAALPELWALHGAMIEAVFTAATAVRLDGQRPPLIGGAAERRFTYSYSPIYDAAGAVGGVFCVLTETTPQAPARLAERLQAVTAALSGAMTPAEVYRAVLEQGVGMLGEAAEAQPLVARSGTMYVLAGDVLELVDRTRATSPLVEQYQRIPLDAPIPAAEAVRTARPIWMRSKDDFIAQYPQLAEQIHLLEGEAAVSLPLVVEGRALGVLNMTFIQPHWFDTDERRFLLTLADQTAQAIERTRLLATLRSSEARYRSLVETSVQVVWRTDSTGAIIDRRKRWSAMTGIPLDRLPSEPLDLVHPDDRASGSAAWWQAVSRKQPLGFEQRVQGADGTYHYWQVRGAPVFDPDGEVREWIGADTDITERKRAEERVRQLNAISLAINAATSTEMLWRLVDGARALVGADEASVTLVADGDWLSSEWVTVPKAGLSYLARSASLKVARLVAAERRPLRLTAADRGAITRSIGWHTPARDAEMLAVPLLNGAGEVIGAVELWRTAGAFSNADEGLLLQLCQIASVALEKQWLYAQEQAARAQAEEASRLKDEFLATISHELRTPLTAFLGYAQLLQSRKRDEAYVARMVEKLVRSAKAQAQLIDDLLDVSRIVSGKLRIAPEPVDLLPVIHAALDTVRPAIEARDLHISIDLRSEARAIIGDANRLQQVVWNLLSNAVKFTPPGGAIWVRLERQGREALITVGDSGQGISAEFLPYVFDRFRQADSASTRMHGGLGLGLAIVRHLVELHGGAVQAASDGEGQGATFTVRLPLAPQSVTLAPETGSADGAEATLYHPELGGLRVLLVDDQPDILELLDAMLSGSGASVRMCSSAPAALAAVREWRPDVLVSDVAMPGEDGYWLIERVRALGADEGGATPAVALTAYVRMEDRLRVLSAGFDLYVPKPVDPAELRDVVARLARPAAAE